MVSSWEINCHDASFCLPFPNHTILSSLSHRLHFISFSLCRACIVSTAQQTFYDVILCIAVLVWDCRTVCCIPFNRSWGQSKHYLSIDLYSEQHQPKNISMIDLHTMPNTSNRNNRKKTKHTKQQIFLVSFPIWCTDESKTWTKHWTHTHKIKMENNTTNEMKWREYKKSKQ